MPSRSDCRVQVDPGEAWAGPCVLVTISLPHRMPTKDSWQLLPSVHTQRMQKLKGVGALDTVGLSTDLEGFLEEGAVGWV